MYKGICCTCHQLKYSSLNRSTTKTRATHKKSIPDQKWFRGKDVQRMDQKQKRIRQTETGLSRRTREEIYIQKSGIKLTALKFHTGGGGGGGGHLNRRPPFGGHESGTGR